MHFVNPPDWDAPSVPLSHAVVSGGFVFVSGQVPRDEAGQPFAHDFEREVSSAIDGLEHVLEAAGSELAMVVKVTAFLSSALLFQAFNDVYARRFPRRPARSTVVVAFGHPDVRVELEAIAVAGNLS